MNSTAESRILEWFNHFHNHPEVSFKEIETTKTLAAIMEELNVSYRTFDDVTGLIAEIGEGSEVVAVRADIDALWQEVKGVYQANHSCGHDANMAMVLGALLQLKEEPLKRRVRFIFQPGEEKGNGALSMIERGAVKDVTHLYGVHLRPSEELPFGKVTPAIHHGAGIFMKGKVIGEDAHGARPQQGKNALDAIFAIQQFVKSIYFSPFESYSAKLTGVQAGGDSLNIIPGTATFSMDVRAQSNDVLKALKGRIEEGFNGIAALYEVEIIPEWEDFIPAAEVHAEAAAIAKEAIEAIVGADGTAEEVATPGGDDFHFYTIKHPELKAAMVGVGADLTPGLHHPNMTFNTKALSVGAAVLAETIRRTVNR